MENVSSLSWTPISIVSNCTLSISRRYQHLLDRTVMQVYCRWIALLLMGIGYATRVYLIQGFYIITYGLGIYLLNLLIGFLSPQADPDVHDTAALPTHESDEFRPFIRRLPEFKFWYSMMKALCMAFVMTFLPFLDVPVFWPILLFYWFVLFVLTMRKQILHMVKHKYVPFSFGKQRYNGKVTSNDT